MDLETVTQSTNVIAMTGGIKQAIGEMAIIIIGGAIIIGGIAAGYGIKKGVQGIYRHFKPYRENKPR